MSRTSSYKEKCYNPQCIQGGVEADYDNEECWLGPDADPKVFCSLKCLNFYKSNKGAFKEEENVRSSVKKNKSHYIKKLTDVIYVYSGKEFDKKIIKYVVEALNLSSPWVK